MRRRLYPSLPLVIVLVSLQFWQHVNGLASSSSLWTPPKKKIAAAVLVPGFLTGAEDFQGLCQEMNKIGIPTIALPMTKWEWASCLGGRSARPILERLDFTVQHLIANKGDITKVPRYKYNVLDAWKDIRTNPGGILQVGGSSRVQDYPIVEPQGTFALPDAVDEETQIALIGHSAGGWISRVYLSDRSYGGKAYSGSQYVHSLVTLGTPHASAPGAPFSGIHWLNEESSGESKVPSLAVAGTGYHGKEWGALTAGSYGFCCPQGTDGSHYIGDGITPTFSALALEGAETLVLGHDDGDHTSTRVGHFPWPDVFAGKWTAPELAADQQQGAQWFGSPEIVPQWAKWILQHTNRAHVEGNSLIQT